MHACVCATVELACSSGGPHLSAGASSDPIAAGAAAVQAAAAAREARARSAARELASYGPRPRAGQAAGRQAQGPRRQRGSAFEDALQRSPVG
eukprot:scaffold2834_cov366-Prasinococcus_capsulatus_cf.AAC.5